MSPNWITTTFLLQGLEQQDQDVWLKFEQRFRRPVQQFARRAGLGEADAEDVAQETLLAFAESYRRGQYQRERSRLQSWLFGIAHKKVADFLRQRQRSGKRISVGGRHSYFAEIPDENAVAAAWESSWEEAALSSCLHQIRQEVQPQTWQVFEQVVLQERPAEDVARESGMTRNAVFIAKHRIIKHMRELRAQYEDV